MPAAGAAPGDVDASFGLHGFADSALGDEPGAYGATGSAIATAPDGKIVVVSGVFYPTSCLPRWGCETEMRGAVSRFEADGSLDSTFAGDGELGDVEFSALTSTDEVEIRDVAVQPDGKIVLVGGYGQFWVARLNVDGSLDTSFGDGGVARHSLLGASRGGSDFGAAVALAPDGRIIVVGRTTSNGSGEYHDAVARLLPDGRLDPGFSDDGWLAGHDRATFPGLIDVEVQGDRIFALDDAGAVSVFGSDGTPDAGFSGDGVAPTRIDKRYIASDLAVDNAGRAVVIAARLSDPNPPAVLRRLTDSGDLDPSWGSEGTAVIDLPEVSGTGPWTPTRIAIDAQSRVLVADGFIGGGTAVGRFTTAGQPDIGFSAGGWSVVFDSKQATSIRDLVVSTDGIYATGGGANHPVVIRRRLDDGPVDTDGDTVTNDADECPFLFGECPEIKLAISDLKYKHSDGGWGLRARLISGDNNCKWKRTVEVYRDRRQGPDVRIATVHSLWGGIHVNRRFRDGRFYATVERRVVAYGFCPAARSNLFALNPRGRDQR